MTVKSKPGRQRKPGQRRKSGAKPARPRRSLAQTLQSQLQRAFSGPVWDTQDARAFVRELYASDAFATSEGSAESWSGTDRFVELAKDVMSRFRKIVFHDWSVCALGPGGASQLIVVDAEPRDSTQPVQVFKVLYTWRKTPRGWRIVHDVTARGGISP